MPPLTPEEELEVRGLTLKEQIDYMKKKDAEAAGPSMGQGKATSYSVKDQGGDTSNTPYRTPGDPVSKKETPLKAAMSQTKSARLTATPEEEDDRTPREQEMDDLSDRIDSATNPHIKANLESVWNRMESDEKYNPAKSLNLIGLAEITDQKTKEAESQDRDSRKWHVAGQFGQQLMSMLSEGKIPPKQYEKYASTLKDRINLIAAEERKARDTEDTTSSKEWIERDRKTYEAQEAAKAKTSEEEFKQAQTNVKSSARIELQGMDRAEKKRVQTLKDLDALSQVKDYGNADWPAIEKTLGKTKAAELRRKSGGTLWVSDGPINQAISERQASLEEEKQVAEMERPIYARINAGLPVKASDMERLVDYVARTQNRTPEDARKIVLFNIRETVK